MIRIKGKKLSDLAALIATHRCVLFAGSGLTADSGGASWNDLVEFLKKEFNYISPLKENFQIINDMYKKYGPEKVYETVQNRLRNAKIDESILEVAKLPWFSVFTTNYDLALETSLRENQSLSLRVVLTGEEFSLDHIQSEILCVKLMGSLDKPYGLPGSMVLAYGDLIIAREQREKIYNRLADHAANLSFLFIGYSFKDELFFEILERIKNSIGRTSIKYYAVFETEPDEEKAYLLDQYNIEVIVASLSTFLGKLSYEVSLRNPEDFSLKRIPIGNDVLPIDAKKIPNFLSLYNPIFFEDLEREIVADIFFKGNIDTFKPFELSWHFLRKEISEVIQEVLKENRENSNILIVKGSPGTGRTFTILAAIHKLIREHRALAIKIPNYSIHRIPSLEDLGEYILEIERASSERSIEGPKRIVFWAEFPLDEMDIYQFKRLAKYKYQTILIFEDLDSSELVEEFPREKDIMSVNVDRILSEEEKADLAEYILNMVRIHRFAQIEKEETMKIIREEEKFLPIIYRTIDPARRSIRRIIQENFIRLSNSVTKDCIYLCALSKSVDLDIPLAILQKSLTNKIMKVIQMWDIFEIIAGEGKAFLKIYMDNRTNYLVSLYHSIIAQYMIGFITLKDMDKYLLNIAKTANLQSRIDAEFIRRLFIDIGVNYVTGPFRPFTDDGLEAAFYEIKGRQPARPILHHLARFYAKKDINNDKIIPLLEEALAEPLEKYYLEERK